MSGERFLSLNIAPCTRPALHYHGGKWRLAPWIIGHFPPHRIYVEPFGGAASVLLRKPRSFAEVYNDLDDDLVNYFRVLRDPELSLRLIRNLDLTPFSRTEFDLSYLPTDDPVERACRCVVRSFMGYGSGAVNSTHRTGFRAASNKSGASPARDWASWPECAQAIVDRIKGVLIENRDAVEVMQHHDGPETCHYVDPPYLPSTRSESARNKNGECHVYRHELSESDHVNLCQKLNGLSGYVVLSGYPSDLYSDLLVGWTAVEIQSLADNQHDRVECLWLNPRCAESAARHALLDMFA